MKGRVRSQRKQKMSPAEYGFTEETAMIKFGRIVRSHEAEHQLKGLHSEVIELGKGGYEFRIIYWKLFKINTLYSEILIKSSSFYNRSN